MENSLINYWFNRGKEDAQNEREPLFCETRNGIRLAIEDAAELVENIEEAAAHYLAGYDSLED